MVIIEKNVMNLAKRIENDEVKIVYVPEEPNTLGFVDRKTGELVAYTRFVEEEENGN